MRKSNAEIILGARITHAEWTRAAAMDFNKLCRDRDYEDAFQKARRQFMALSILRDRDRAYEQEMRRG